MARVGAMFCCLGLAIGGCHKKGSSLGTVEAGLSASGAGATLAASVHLQTPYGACTGTALTDHWILTAAHCAHPVDSTDIISVSVASPTGAMIAPPMYSSVYETFRYPLWDGYQFAGRDIGLIYLRGSGLANFTPRGSLFSDTRHPWYGDYIMNGWTEGFGWGSSPGVGGCGQPHGTLRRNLLRPEGSGGALAISSHDGLFCKADSGGPWMWRLTDSDFVMVQYAVYSGSYWGGDVGGSWFETYAVAAALPRALPWIEQTMRSRLPPTLDLIVTERVATGYKYRTYREQPMKQLLVSFSGKGTLATSPMPYSCKTSPCAFRLPPGTAVSVTATAEIGYRFSGWTDCPSPSGNRCDVTLSADKSMSARFVLSPNCTFDAMCAAECTQDCLANGGRDCPRKCERECTICQ